MPIDPFEMVDTDYFQSEEEKNEGIVIFKCAL